MRKIITAMIALSFVLLAGCSDAEADAKVDTAKKSEITHEE